MDIKGLYWTIALCVAAIIIPETSHASTKVVRCDNCSNGSMELVARQVPGGVIEGIHIYVVDMADGGISHWYKKVDYETKSMIFLPMSVSNDKVNAFLDVRSVYFQIVASADNIIEIPSNEFTSIYEISGCPSCANIWMNENIYSIANQIPLYDQFHESVGNLAFEFGLPRSGVAISLELEAGLKYKVVLTSDDANGPLPAYCMGSLSATGFQIDAGSCHDSDGNEIPVDASDMALGYRFSRQRNLNNFGGRLTSLGVPLYGVGTVTVGNPVSVECAEDSCEAK